VAGIDVADLGCGSGYALNVLGRAFPSSRFRGYDLSEEATAAARAHPADWGLDNVTFEVRDITDLDLTDAFDLITTFDAIHDQADPARVLRAIANALRPEGVHLCVDIAASSHLEDNVEHPRPFSARPGVRSVTWRCRERREDRGGRRPRGTR